MADLRFREIKEDAAVGILNAILKQVKDSSVASDTATSVVAAVNMQAQKRPSAFVTHLMNEIVVNGSNHSRHIGRGFWMAQPPIFQLIHKVFCVAKALYRAPLS